MKNYEQIATETHNDIETVRVAMHMAVKTGNGWTCDGYHARTRQAAVSAYLTRHISEPIGIWADDPDAIGDEVAAQADYVDAETLDMMGDDERLTFARESVELHRTDAADMFRGCTLTNPVIVFARAGLRDVARDDLAVIEPDTIADIIDGPAPYRGMDGNRFQVNENDELEYVGTHHDGTNTAIYREWVGDDIPDDVLSLNVAELYAHTRAMGPDVRRALGLSA